MLLSRETIEALNEADLRREVLSPLFIAMGFRDVEETHGMEELGKDIVMWKPDIVRIRQNFAVVAKAGRIDSKNREEVLRQIDECFGADYPNPVSGESLSVDRVLVIASSKITRHTKKSIRAALKTRGLDDRVDFLGGDLLMERVRKFLSRELVWDAMHQAKKVLEESFKDHRSDLLVSSEGMTSIVLTEKPGTDVQVGPLNFTIRTTFPPTPEGTLKYEEMQRFLKEGEPVELDAEFLDELDYPEVFSALSPGATVQTIKMGPSLIDPPLLRRCILVGSGGTCFVLDYVHFTHSQGGSESAAITNLGQGIPFRVRLSADRKNPGRGSFNISWELRGDPDAYFFWQVSTLQRVFSEGGVVIIKDWHTNVTEIELPFAPDPSYTPPEGALELARQLALIQTATGVVLRVGEQGFGDEDLSEIAWVAEVVNGGRHLVKDGTATVVLTDETESPPCHLHEGAHVSISQVVTENEVVEILGEGVELGPKLLQYDGPIATVESVEERTAFTIQASDDLPIILLYPKWARLPAYPNSSEPT